MIEPCLESSEMAKAALIKKNKQFQSVMSLDKDASKQPATVQH